LKAYTNARVFIYLIQQQVTVNTCVVNNDCIV